MEFRKCLTAAASACGLLMMATDASAGGFVWSGYYLNQSTGGAIELYSYYDNTSVAYSLAAGPACNGYTWQTAPIMVVFGGSLGTGYEYGGFTDIADRLNRKACTRVVYVRQINAQGYFLATGTADPRNPAYKANNAAGNIAWAMDRVLTYFYPSAKRVTYVGGSASAGLGAKLLEMKFGELVTPTTSTVPWSRVKRFIFAGPPIGNLATACRYTSAASTFYGIPAGFTGKANCTEYLNFLAANGVPDTSGNLYGFASETTKTTARNAGLRINMFVGTEDELFGWPAAGTATGPQGVENFMAVSNLWPNLTGIPSTAATAAAHVDAGITYGTMSATHSNVWSRPSVVKAVCYLAAKETSSMNPAAQSQYLARCDE